MFHIYSYFEHVENMFWVKLIELIVYFVICFSYVVLLRKWTKPLKNRWCPSTSDESGDFDRHYDSEYESNDLAADEDDEERIQRVESSAGKEIRLKQNAKQSSENFFLISIF